MPMSVAPRISDETTLDPLEAARFFLKNLREPAHILVAISGGSDSTGLLLALRAVLSCEQNPGTRLSAVTIDHALRPESADEAKKVAALCAELGVPHFIRRWDDPKPPTGLSEASRLARYRLIADVADTIGADAVVTGHTLGDQRETIAMRVARSDRHDNIGLAGMADAVLFDRRLWVLRPFLACERQPIRNFILAQGKDWVDDPSNESVKYERVRVRQSLGRTPLADYNKTSVARTALCLAAAEFLRANVQVFHSVLAKINISTGSEECPEFRHALAALIATLGGRAYFPAASGMDRAIEPIVEGRSGRLTLGRVLIDRKRDGLYLYRERRNLPEICLEAGESAIWDDRFFVENASANEVRITSSFPNAASTPFSLNIPPGVVRQAIWSMPTAVTASSDEAFDARALKFVPRVAPFDLFLPRFDLELANAIAVLLGRSAYPQPPV